MNRARQLIETTRQQIGNSAVSLTARRLDKLLRQGGFHYMFVGGYAVQEHGYARFTVDVDLVVRERGVVTQYLLATGEFRRVPGSAMTIVDRKTGVPVDLLPAGRSDSLLAPPYPTPTTRKGGLQFATLPELISLKLGAGRMKDKADVVELIKANGLRPAFQDELPAGLRDQFVLLQSAAEAEQV